MSRIPALSRRSTLAGVGSLAVLGLGAGASRRVLGLESVELTESGVSEQEESPDVRLAWQELYNGEVLAESGFVTEFPDTGPEISFGNVLPGDTGALVMEVGIESGEGPAAVEFALSVTGTSDNGLTEPEAKTGDEAGDGGELQGRMTGTVWYDIGSAGASAAGAQNGRREPFEPLLTDGSTGTLRDLGDALAGGVRLDPTPTSGDAECFAPADTVTVALRWRLPARDGVNVVQGDSAAFDIAFRSIQDGSCEG